MFRILGRAGDHEDASNLDLLESWDQIGKQTPLIVCITKPIQKPTRTTEWIQEPRVVIAMLFSLLYISVWSWCYLPVSLLLSQSVSPSIGNLFHYLLFTGLLLHFLLYGPAWYILHDCVVWWLQRTLYILILLSAWLGGFILSRIPSSVPNTYSSFLSLVGTSFMFALLHHCSMPPTNSSFVGIIVTFFVAT